MGRVVLGSDCYLLKNYELVWKKDTEENPGTNLCCITKLQEFLTCPRNVKNPSFRDPRKCKEVGRWEIAELSNQRYLWLKRKMVPSGLPCVRIGQAL